MTLNYNKNKIISFGLVILAAILGGGAGVFGKIALREIPPFSFTFLRFFIASIFLLPFFIKDRPKFNKDNYKVILLSLLATANVVLFAFGIRHTTANISQMIYTAVPIISAIFSFFILKEKFGFKKLSGILIGFIGTIVIIILPLISNSAGLPNNIYGSLTIFVASISISLYWVLSKQFHGKYSPMQINNYFILTTTFFLFLLSIYDLIKNPSWWHQISLYSLFSLLYVAILSTAIYYLITQVLVKRATPVIATMVLYIQPFATFVWAYLFLSETLTTLFIIGGLLSLVGVWITTSSK